MSRCMYCPFIKTDFKDKCNKNKIKCEFASVSFPSDEEYKMFVDHYCGSMSGWHDCTIARSTTDYYERIDG